MSDSDYAPAKAICPVCKSLCSRRYKKLRKPRDLSLDSPKVIEIEIGVYRCKTCNKLFSYQPDFLEKGKHYTKRVIEKVVFTIRDDKATFSSLPNRFKRDFNINLSKSTCHDWFQSKARLIDLSKEYEIWVVKRFSGALAIDEVFDGGRCMFVATDSLNNTVIAFHRSDSRDQEELIILLERIKGMGIAPEVFISDDAPIYDNTPKQVFGNNLKHQACTFHFISNCTKNILDAIRFYRRTLPKEPKKREKEKHPKKFKIQTEKAKERKLLWKHRYIFTTKHENLSREQLFILKYLCSRHPFLKMVSRLKDCLFSLFSKSNTSKKEVLRKRNNIVRKCLPFVEDSPHLRKIIKRLKSNTFEKALTFMDYENLVSNNNQVERTNRWFKKRQKIHYRNRKEENIVNMLKADLIAQMESNKDRQPVKLKPKSSKVLRVA